MKTAEQAASECGNAMCEKYGLTIDHSIPCEEAFLQGVEYAARTLTPITNSKNRKMERAINEVFIDDKNFNPAMRLKCVEAVKSECDDCAYDYSGICHLIKCFDSARNDGKNVKFVETDEPLTEQE